ncbi:MAG: TIGR03905 family TSCPD domain-containing protein, partial [Clostridia bacterium]|nr:TIGR03905 family TSCPD domain-containing protein [Clostridia bacterium]
MHYTYHPKMVCSVQIDFDINDGVVSNVAFTRGCNGNLKAISKLVDGMKAQDIADKL